MARRADFRIGNWAEGIGERFDLILCNPPYVAADAETGPGVADFEPAEALFAGPEGLDDYRRLAPEIGRLLASGGLAAIEIGFDQAESAAELLRQQGLSSSVALTRDARGAADPRLVETRNFRGSPLHQVRTGRP